MLIIVIVLSLLPFLFPLTQTATYGLLSTVANVAGLVGIALLLWQLVLGNRFISAKIKGDYLANIKLHTYLGIYGFLLIISHPFLEALAYGGNLALLLNFDLSSEFGEHLFLGRLALLAYLALWLSSTLIRKRLSFRAWRLLHYLSYPLVLFALLHAIAIGTFLNQFFLLKIYFILLLLIFMVMVIYRFLQLINVTKAAYLVKAKTALTQDVNSYTLLPKKQSLIPQVGQFFFLQPNLFAESHPFTVAYFHEQTGELTFMIKAFGQFTQQLTQLRLGQTVFLDGPYGVFTKPGQNDQPKVILAGGIGITPFLELVQRFANHKTKLFYANRHLTDAFARAELKKKLGRNYFDVISKDQVKFKKDPQLIIGRINAAILRQHLPAEFFKQANFFICGSAPFMQGILKALENLGVAKTRIFVENFSL